MADKTVADLYQDAIKELKDTRQELRKIQQEFNSKLIKIDQLESALKSTNEKLEELSSIGFATLVESQSKIVGALTKAGIPL
jgi:peptidoglycan hydrolase CwlO-like protein